MVHLLNKVIQFGHLVSGLYIFLEDTDCCENKYRYALAIYLMNVLLSLYGIIMDRSINAPGHGKNVFDDLNATEKCYLK